VNRITKVISCELVNGIRLSWTLGLTKDVRDAVRLYQERYPDLLPEDCRRLVVSWDLRRRQGPTTFHCEPVKGDRGTYMLSITEAWHGEERSAMESRYLFDMQIDLLIEQGILVPQRSGSGWDLRDRDGKIRTEFQRDVYLNQLADYMLELRQEFGGGNPPYIIPPEEEVVDS